MDAMGILQWFSMQFTVYYCSHSFVYVWLCRNAKLYRFDKDAKQWKERGVETVKLLEQKEATKVWLVMRQYETFKICANHLNVNVLYYIYPIF